MHKVSNAMDATVEVNSLNMFLRILSWAKQETVPCNFMFPPDTPKQIGSRRRSCTCFLVLVVTAKIKTFKKSKGKELALIVHAEPRQLRAAVQIPWLVLI